MLRNGPDIRHLGHASFAVAYAGVRLLIDPWFNPAFLASWFPWPHNRHLIDDAWGDVLYISHAHEDHFDRKFLSGLDKSTRVLLPAFRSRYLERELRTLGFANLAVLGHGDREWLAPGFTVTMLLDRSHKEDSALLMDCGGFRFLDSNDCDLATADLPRDVDLLACQFSGAIWYPHCYAYPPEVMAAKAAQVREANLGRVVRRVRLTGAKAYWPSAGPACFLDPALAAYNDRAGIFPLWEDVEREFGRRAAALR